VRQGFLLFFPFASKQSNTTSRVFVRIHSFLAGAKTVGAN
jgi:hypothetical protein